MDAFQLVTRIGKSACELAQGVTSPFVEPYVCGRHEYFDTGAAVLALLTVVLLAAWNEVRRQRNRSDSYL